MVSVLAFHSDDPSSNPAKVYRSYSQNCLERTRINDKKDCRNFLQKHRNVDNLCIVLSLTVVGINGSNDFMTTNALNEEMFDKFLQFFID